MLSFLVAKMLIRVGDPRVSNRILIRGKVQIVFILECCIFRQISKEVKLFVQHKELASFLHRSKDVVM